MARLCFALLLSACSFTDESRNKTTAICLASQCVFSEANKAEDIEGDSEAVDVIEQENITDLQAIK